jgi:hypothetical protein
VNSPFHVIKIQTGLGRVDQVVENLPSKCKALSSNPSNIKKKKKNPNYGVEPHGCHGQKVPPEIAFCRKKVLIGTTTALKHYQAGHYRALTMA